MTGCASSASRTGPRGESPDEVMDAAGKVIESMSGQAMTEEEKRALLKQLRTDKEARSAIKSISDSYQPNRIIKYNPRTGERFAPHLEFDPRTGEKLEVLGD